MAFTAQNVKELRERTGVGMMESKKALVEADGDMDRAVEILRERGMATAEKKASRIASDGMVFAINNAEKKVGVVLEVNSETDFVAKNESFQEFVKSVAEIVLDENPADVDVLLECKMGDGTVGDELREKIVVIGENLKIRRFERFEGVTAAYVHAGGTHGILVKFNADDAVASKPEFFTYGKDIAMHVAASNPAFLSRASVDTETLEKERHILKAQALNEGKPENIAEKMVMGRINKYYETNCLLDQKFVKDPEITVEQYTKNVAKELGGNIEITGFARFEKGEGLEKRSEDFASEVASMM